MCEFTVLRDVVVLLHHIKNAKKSKIQASIQIYVQNARYYEVDWKISMHDIHHAFFVLKN